MGLLFKWHKTGDRQHHITMFHLPSILQRTSYDNDWQHVRSDRKKYWHSNIQVFHVAVVFWKNNSNPPFLQCLCYALKSLVSWHVASCIMSWYPGSIANSLKKMKHMLLIGYTTNESMKLSKEGTTRHDFRSMNLKNLCKQHKSRTGKKEKKYKWQSNMTFICRYPLIHRTSLLLFGVNYELRIEIAHRTGTWHLYCTLLKCWSDQMSLREPTHWGSPHRMTIYLLVCGW